MPAPSSDIAFTPAVKAVQARRRSRAAYAELEARGGFRTAIDETLVTFLAGVDTAYLATANAAGQPYAQHRGGPRGFIRPLDAHPWPSPTMRATASTSPPAISTRTPRPSCS